MTVPVCLESIMQHKLETLGQFLRSRNPVQCDLPVEFTQLLNKLVDVPSPCANSNERIQREATEVNNGIQPDHLRRRRA
jgi:hypothetical protein